MSTISAIETAQMSSGLPQVTSGLSNSQTFGTGASDGQPGPGSSNTTPGPPVLSPGNSTPDSTDSQTTGQDTVDSMSTTSTVVSSQSPSRPSSGLLPSTSIGTGHAIGTPPITNGPSALGSPTMRSSTAPPSTTFPAQLPFCSTSGGGSACGENNGTTCADANGQAHSLECDVIPTSGVAILLDSRVDIWMQSFRDRTDSCDVVEGCTAIVYMSEASTCTFFASVDETGYFEGAQFAAVQEGLGIPSATISYNPLSTTGIGMEDLASSTFASTWLFEITAGLGASKTTSLQTFTASTGSPGSVSGPSPGVPSAPGSSQYDSSFGDDSGIPEQYQSDSEPDLWPSMGTWPLDSGTDDSLSWLTRSLTTTNASPPNYSPTTWTNTIQTSQTTLATSPSPDSSATVSTRTSFSTSFSGTLSSVAASSASQAHLIVTITQFPSQCPLGTKTVYTTETVTSCPVGMPCVS
ncbi:hypothetical protein CLAFUW4_12179 [Fulvia fulva]|uniref:Uncharacterized protein n=1 Tax=Passalora fulva TaxID=5499 RepID=A0A9Q8PF21_PASFU|nr:uncharacterized protein CLAFUR5_11216 [Fulvia fulva]KAK4618636.1 hypothetical protein CLAFUR0_12195 [Fulvia fulva]UJO21227.1 hypothetical protein CLAFUR5_11216 [Fulvia fulva]WPV18014.1 hypothetical protein CLAFUW4_12179 [Fulvia fulva]WPV33098.1 hypothetical protein CLAFUW7_12186 [Fulvia fulva]